MIYYITESQLRKLIETARIQPYKGVVKGKRITVMKPMLKGSALTSQCMIPLNH